MFLPFYKENRHGNEVYPRSHAGPHRRGAVFQEQIEALTFASCKSPWSKYAQKHKELALNAKGKLTIETHLTRRGIAHRSTSAASLSVPPDVATMVPPGAAAELQAALEKAGVECRGTVCQCPFHNSLDFGAHLYCERGKWVIACPKCRLPHVWRGVDQNYSRPRK